MANLIWPFTTREPSQEGRTDEGWDLVSVPGRLVQNVASGTIHRAGPDPGGFGTDYPVLKLDQPISIGGHTFDSIYYGHVHMSVPPGHYVQGQVIGHTGTAGNLGGSGAPGEVEIGFGDPNKPGGISYSYGPLIKQALSGAGSTMTGADQSGASLFGDAADGLGSLTGIASALGNMASALSAFGKLAIWLAMPTHWVRIFAGGFGIVFVFFGLSMIAKEVRNG